MRPALAPTWRTRTPVEPVGRRWGRDLFVKREDRIDPWGFGHKVRKVHHVFSAARAAGVTDVVLDGCVTSNCCACAATYARSYGLGARLVLRADRPEHVEGNHARMLAGGADVRFVGAGGDATAAKEEWAESLRTAGANPLVLATSMSTTVALGAGVDLAREIRAFEWQTGITVDVVFIAAGTGGSVLGLTIGRALLGRSWRVVGVCIDDLPCEGYAPWLEDSYRRARAEAYPSLPSTPTLPDLYWPQWHQGYGIPATAALAEATRVERLHGIRLDARYMAKTWTGAMDWLAAHRGVGIALVVHTGGTLQALSKDNGK